MAVTMLLRSARRKEVQGITVVSGNVWARDGAGFMLRNARLLGVPELPVLVGTEAPLRHTVARRKRENGIAFAGAFDLPLPSGQTQPLSGGVDFLIRSIEAAPGRVTILAIGPLTNLARVLQLRPAIAGKIRSVVMMGGAVHVPGNASRAAEFNFWFDPEAAREVLRSEIPEKVLFALDVCNKAHFTKRLFDEIVAVKTPVTELYREDFGNGYPGFLKNQKAQGSLWDELAAAYVINPKLVKKSETMWLDVETAFGPSYGAVRTSGKAGTPVTVVLDMDFDAVLALYRKALTAHREAD